MSTAPDLPLFRNKRKKIGIKFESQEGYTKQMIHSIQPRQVQKDWALLNQPAPQEVDAKALSYMFKLEHPERDDGSDRVTTSLELGCHTNDNVSDSLRGPLEFRNALTHQEAYSNDDPTGLGYLLK